MSDSTPVRVILPQEDIEVLDYLATSMNTSRSHIIRQCYRHVMNNGMLRTAIIAGPLDKNRIAGE